MKLCIFLFLFLQFILIGCQTSMYHQFEQVNLGMDKDDVLQIMGSPQRTQRWRGKDRWTFVFYEDRIRFEKEVQFHEGIATYVGQIWQPPKEESAEYIDQKNKERSEYLDKIAYAPIVITDTNFKNEVMYQPQIDEQKSNLTEIEAELIYIPTFEPVESEKSINTTSGSR